jgi:hypothetical protein
MFGWLVISLAYVVRRQEYGATKLPNVDLVYGKIVATLTSVMLAARLAVSVTASCAPVTGLSPICKSRYQDASRIDRRRNSDPPP